MARTAAPDHVPRSPSLLALTIVELLFSIIVLGLVAYEQYGYNEVADSSYVNILSGALGFGLFTTIVSILYVIYWLVTTRVAFSGYHKIADLVLVSALVLFWLITWALFARIMALLNQTYRIPVYSTTTGRIIGYETVTTDSSIKGIFGAILAFSLLNWLLFIVTFVLLIFAHRYHARGTATNGTTTTYDQGYAKEAPVNHELHPATHTTHTAPVTTTTPTTAAGTESLPHAATPAQTQQV